MKGVSSDAMKLKTKILFLIFLVFALILISPVALSDTEEIDCEDGSCDWEYLCEYVVDCKDCAEQCSKNCLQYTCAWPYHQEYEKRYKEYQANPSTWTNQQYQAAYRKYTDMLQSGCGYDCTSGDCLVCVISQDQCMKGCVESEPECYTDEDCGEGYACIDGECVYNFESICDDGIDNDNDGYTDCEDSDCLEDPACIETICNDEIDNDNDGYIDCEDSDCMDSEFCQIFVSIEASSDEVIADGESHISLEISVTEGGEPLEDNDYVSIWIETDIEEWEDKLDSPDPPGDTLYGGRVESDYIPWTIYLESQETGDYFDPIPATIHAEHTESGAHGSKNIIILPMVDARIIVLEAFQTLRNQPLVAGKKMVAMVGIRATTSQFFVENENYRAFIDFELKGAEFVPQNQFYEINLASTGPTEDSYFPDGSTVVRVKDSAALAKHIDFFELNDPEGTDNWIFYEFYVDGKDTHYEGTYKIEAVLYIEKENPITGEIEYILLDTKGMAYDVFASGFISINLIPVGIGMWYPDFCKYCVKEKDPSFWDKVNIGGLRFGDAKYISKRLAYAFGKEEAALDIYEFTCDLANFTSFGAGFSFSGVVNAGQVNAILNKDDSIKRTACRLGFENMLKKRNYTLAKLVADSPMTTGKGQNKKTSRQRYRDLAMASKAYFRAVYPVAEENIFFRTSYEPFRSSLLNPKTTSPMRVLWSLRSLQQTGRRWSRALYTPDFIYTYAVKVPVETALPDVDASVWPYKIKGFDRTAAFVPTDAFGVSNVLMASKGFTGYMNNAINRYSVLIDVDNADRSVMSHEILHTYCAVDEYTSWLGSVRQATIGVFAACSEGYLRINKNRGTDKQGTPVTNGYWVEKRKFMGTPADPGYSLMGEVTATKKWITDDLYYGVGVKLHTFPVAGDVRSE